MVGRNIHASYVPSFNLEKHAHKKAKWTKRRNFLQRFLAPTCMSNPDRYFDIKNDSNFDNITPKRRCPACGHDNCFKRSSSLFDFNVTCPNCDEKFAMCLTFKFENGNQDTIVELGWDQTIELVYDFLVEEEINPSANWLYRFCSDPLLMWNTLYNGNWEQIPILINRWFPDNKLIF